MKFRPLAPLAALLFVVPAFSLSAQSYGHDDVASSNIVEVAAAAGPESGIPSLRGGPGEDPVRLVETLVLAN